jgi:tetratricopeptide (TPR) repeat protein
MRVRAYGNRLESRSGSGGSGGIGAKDGRRSSNEASRSPGMASRRRSRLLRSAVVILLAVLGGCQGGQWQQHLQEGARALEQGHYVEANRLLELARQEAEGFGSNDVRLASSLEILAELYRAQKRYGDAEPLYRRALAIREKSQGPEHSAVAETLSGLGDLYRAEGRYADAEPLYRRALAIWEANYGPRHPQVAAALESLADLYRTEDRYADAEPLYRKALATWEATLGRTHPHVASLLESYATILHGLGREAEARALQARARAILGQEPGSPPVSR